MTTMSITRALAAVSVLAAAATLAGCAPEPTGPVVAFYGDSYTLGTGATSHNARWSTQVSRDRGWNEFNPSVNGLGFVTNRAGTNLVEDIIAREPEIVFVTMGLNDNFSFSGESEKIHEQIDTDIDRLATALPDARLIVVEPFWYTDNRPESVETIIGWVHDAADRVDADYIEGASHWIEGHPEWMASDGLHPNDDGYAEMTVRMEEALVALGLPPTE